MDVLTKKFVEWRTNPLGGNHRAPGVLVWKEFEN